MHCTGYGICAMSVNKYSCDQWVLQQRLEETEHRIHACIFIWKSLVVYLTVLLINKVGVTFHLSILCRAIDLYCTEFGA
jgi:hypothetical protein